TTRILTRPLSPPQRSVFDGPLTSQGVRTARALRARVLPPRTPRLEPLDPAFDRDPNRAGVLLAPDHVEGVPLLLQVEHPLGVARMHAQSHEVAAVHEGQALQQELHPLLAFEPGDLRLPPLRVR